VSYLDDTACDICHGRIEVFERTTPLFARVTAWVTPPIEIEVGIAHADCAPDPFVYRCRR
jgi:hypothetical protein